MTYEVPREILERNLQELTEQLYGSYKRITFLNERVDELEKENAALKEEIEVLADERT
jgi:chromosome segregation ATPase